MRQKRDLAENVWYGVETVLPKPNLPFLGQAYKVVQRLADLGPPITLPVNIRGIPFLSALRKPFFHPAVKHIVRRQIPQSRMKPRFMVSTIPASVLPRLHGPHTRPGAHVRS
jgi:hypothetical protein